jgi:hypothetical protein
MKIEIEHEGFCFWVQRTEPSFRCDAMARSGFGAKRTWLDLLIARPGRE